MTLTRFSIATAFSATSLSLVFFSTALAQSGSSGPMFSTPASRSTTGAPILNEPSAAPKEGIIGSAGGGSGAGRSPQPTPSGSPQSASAPAVAAQPPKEVAVDRFSDWELQCQALSENDKICQVSARVASPDGRQIILVMSLANDPASTATRMQMAVPLGIAVSQQIGFKVAPSFQTTFPVSRCTPQGCLAEGTVEPTLLKAMREGSQAEVSVATPEGTRIPITLKLDGFSAALDALDHQAKRALNR